MTLIKNNIDRLFKMCQTTYITYEQRDYYHLHVIVGQPAVQGSYSCVSELEFDTGSVILMFRV